MWTKAGMKKRKVLKKEIPGLKMQDVGGADLPYLYYEGSTPQFLFAHATGFLPWLWHPVAKEFAPSSKVWVPYICNYRECDPEKGGLSWDIIAKDLATFCTKLQIKKRTIGKVKQKLGLI